MKRKIALFFIAAFSAAAIAAVDLPGELRIAYRGVRLDLNPLHAYTSTEAQIFTGIYEGLVAYDPETLDPVPAVAKSWERSADRKTYTFRLRDDAMYSDGTKVRAQDFRDTWIRMITPREKAEYSSLFDVIKGAKNYRLGKTEDQSSVGIRVKNDTTLEVELDYPVAYFVKLLCHHAFGPVAPAMNSSNYSSAASIVCNGPYRIDGISAQEMTLKKNAYYWDRASVAIQTVRIVFINDDDLATDQYNSENLDWLAGPMNLDTVLSRGHIQTNVLFATHYFYFASREKPWNDGRVRRGIALLMPWKEIRPEFLAATTLVASVPGYPEVKGIEDANVEEGKKALADAGYPEGVGLPKLVIAVPSGGVSERAGNLMADSVRKNTKIDVEARVIDNDEYFDLMRGRDYVIGSATWIGDFADPLTFLQMWTADSNLNDAGFSDPEFERLIQLSMTQEGNDRYESLSKAESVLLQTAQVLPESFSAAINVIDADVDTGSIKGWYPNLLDIHPFKNMRFGERKAPPNVVLGVPVFEAAGGTALASAAPLGE